ncbi:hypothetical protein N431DRAFT_507832 [Stipitochalara longipes BDJ]|nr:hypothetical protein N431DRAFT_507832 [Stipitochalara longipes BDJ]
MSPRQKVKSRREQKDSRAALRIRMKPLLRQLELTLTEIPPVILNELGVNYIPQKAYKPDLAPDALDNAKSITSLSPIIIGKLPPAIDWQAFSKRHSINCPPVQYNSNYPNAYDIQANEPSKEWVFRRSKDVTAALDYFIHNPEDLARFITAGFLVGSILILILLKGKEWEERSAYLIPAGAFEEKRVVYLYFLHQITTLRLPQTFVYGGTAASEGRPYAPGGTIDRMHSHSYRKDTLKINKDTQGSRHVQMWQSDDVTDGGFFVITNFGPDTPRGVYEIAEEFTIAALGLFEGPRFLELTSRINLPVVANRPYRHLGLGLNGDTGLVTAGQNPPQLRSEIDHLQ